MRTKYLAFILILGALVASTLACNYVAATPTVEPGGAQALYTQAAQTIVALITQEAVEAQQTQVAGALTPVVTSTAPSGDATLPTPTGQTLPSATPAAPSATLSPTQPPATATPKPPLCDQARFVKDVTVSDGSVFGPGAGFTKIWRLENIGTCTWDSSYDLVQVGGERMDAPRSVALPGRVRPGETIDLAVSFEAPSKAATYRSNWMLRNASGKLFGIGADAATAFWVEIRVSTSRPAFAYDFAVNYCAADWRSGSGQIPCPGNSSSDQGSIVMVDHPELENGRNEDEPALWMRPNANSDGWISGTFPAYKVRENDHFVSEIGCLENSSGCEVRFRLEYRLQNGSVKKLADWEEVSDGKGRVVDVDLSSLAGETVNIILTVENEGKSNRANAYWFVPSVRQVTPTPTPTQTSTATQTATLAPATATATTAPATVTPTATATQEPTATSTTTLTATPTETPTVTPTQDLNAILASQAAQHRLAQDLGLQVNEVIVQSVQAVEWNDSCLGVHLPGVVCAAVITPGYRVVLAANGKLYEAHTDQIGSTIFWFEL